MQALDQAQVVDHFGDFGKDFADPLSAFSVLRKAIGTFHQIAGLGKLHTWLLTGIGFAVITPKGRLVIEGVDLRRSTVHEQKDDPLRTRCKSREPWRQWADPLAREGRALVGHRPLAQEAVQGQSAKAG